MPVADVVTLNLIISLVQIFSIYHNTHIRLSAPQITVQLLQEEIFMPMIEAKVTVNLPEEKRNVLKAELGKAITIIGKPESYLMINLIDKQDLYFAGKKLEKGAYVEVKVLGKAYPSKTNEMTARLCDVFESILGIPQDAVYISYWGTDCWGWNGSNF